MGEVAPGDRQTAGQTQVPGAQSRPVHLADGRRRTWVGRRSASGQRWATATVEGGSHGAEGNAERAQAASPTPDKPWATVDGVAALLGVSPRWLAEQCRS